MRSIITIAAVLFLSGCQQSQQSQESITGKSTILTNYEDAQKQKLIKSEITSAEHSERFKAKYNELFGGQKLEFAKYDDKVLKELWLASYMMASYTLGQEYVQQMESIFNNLKRRGIEGECFEGPCVDDLFSIYLRSSDFSKARQLAQQYPAIRTGYVPDINEDASVLHKPYRLYKISPDGKSLNLISTHIDEKKQIIALMNPECHFAQQAMDAISATPDLKDYFEKHALIVYPVYSSIAGIAKTAEWNKKNPKLEYFVYLNKNGLREDWKQYDLKALTDFYFLKNNRIVYRIPGWGPSKKEFIAEMRNAINKLNSGI